MRFAQIPTLHVFCRLRRWLPAAVLALCAGTMLGQSLGDVAREQRNDPNRPKARRVITNGDIASAGSEEMPAAPRQNQTAGQSKTKAAAPNQAPADGERAMVQRRINELNERFQLLQRQLNDLEQQRTELARSVVYGDPKRAQQNTDIKEMGEAIEAKSREVSAARNELADEMERARKTSIMK